MNGPVGLTAMTEPAVTGRDIAIMRRHSCFAGRKWGCGDGHWIVFSAVAMRGMMGHQGNGEWNLFLQEKNRRLE